MKSVKLLRKSFNMCVVKRPPVFMSPYTFISSTPDEITLICPEEDTPRDALVVDNSYSCFVVSESKQIDNLNTSSALSKLLARAGIELNIITSCLISYIFVKSDNVIDAIQLLTNKDYEIEYSDYF